MEYYGLPVDTQAFRQHYLDSFRNILSPEYRNIPDDALAETLLRTFEELSPEEQNAFAVLSLQNSYENFFRDLGNALPSIVRAVAPVAQIAAPVVGTLIGGPAGTAIGTAVGGLIGNFAAQGGAGPSPAAPPPAPPPARVAVPRAALAQTQPQTPQVAAQGSPAAGQLMSLLANPQIIQALLGQLMGALGNGSATVQRGAHTTAIPFASLMNTISEYALRAAEESVRNGDFESATYMTDHWGRPLVNDPSDTSERADAVYKILSEQSSYAARAHDPAKDSRRNTDPVTGWLLSAGMVG